MRGIARRIAELAGSSRGSTAIEESPDGSGDGHMATKR